MRIKVRVLMSHDYLGIKVLETVVGLPKTTIHGTMHSGRHD